MSPHAGPPNPQPHRGIGAEGSASSSQPFTLGVMPLTPCIPEYTPTQAPRFVLRNTLGGASPGVTADRNKVVVPACSGSVSRSSADAMNW